MNKKNILFITELVGAGSGYTYLTLPLMKGLQELGHDVKAIGLGNRGEEHNLPISILPARDFKSAHGIAHNLHFLSWKPDVTVVAFDIPHQHFMLEKLRELPSKYIAITPLENPPFTMSWASPFFNADGLFLISQIATQAAWDVGLTEAKHLKVGADISQWYPASDEKRESLKKAMGLEDKFVVLTVADNQERKNLWAAMDIVAKAKESGIDNLKYILVTREHSHVGHKLRDLAFSLGISQELTIIERGISQEDLLTWYQLSDVYLQTSKAEGLGLPVLEALATGIPIIATDTGAMSETLADGRGWLIEPEYSFIDVWGNSKRDMIDRKKAADLLISLANEDAPIMAGAEERKKKALDYIKSLTWDIPVQQLADMIEEVTNEQN